MQLRQLRHVIDPPKGIQRPEFDVAFIKKSTGEIVKGRCVCTSSNFKNDTFTLKFMPSEQVRTVAALSVIQFNHEEITP